MRVFSKNTHGRLFHLESKGAIGIPKVSWELRNTKIKFRISNIIKQQKNTKIESGISNIKWEYQKTQQLSREY